MTTGIDNVPLPPSSRPSTRPLIDMTGRIICHNGTPTRVVLTEKTISVGCSDITPEAAQFILDKWKESFGTAKIVVLQNY